MKWCYSKMIIKSKLYNSRIFKVLKSMKLLIFILLVSIGIVPSIFLFEFIMFSYNEEAYLQRFNELQSYYSIINNLIITSDYFKATDIQYVQNELNQIANLYDCRIIIVDGSLKIITDTYKLQEGKTIISTDIIKCFNNISSTNIDKKNQYIELIMPINNENKDILGAVIMRCPTRNIYYVNSAVKRKGVLIIAIIFVIVLLIAGYFCTYLTKPFKNVTKSIKHISQGYLDDEVSFKGYTEFETMAKGFNQMLAKLRQLEDSRQEFVSNVSHELKTPITSMKVLADSLITQEDVPVEFYKEFMVDIASEIERENKIINDLLSLVKMNKKASDLNITNININELLEVILKRIRPIAAERNIELLFESFRPVSADVDEVKISLIFSNLIENAVKYNFDNGWVKVSLNADHKYFFVTVADNGVGIPEDEQENIFERFYRIDKARSRETGGTGLGLSITRNAILMHRGAIKVHSKVGEGTTFTVRIPINYVSI